MLRASMIEKYYTKVALPVTRRSRWSPTDLNVRDVGAAFGAAISAVVFFFFYFVVSAKVMEVTHLISVYAPPESYTMRQCQRVSRITNR